MAQQAYHITSLNKALISVLICTLALFPAVFSSRLGIISPFLHGDAAAIILGSSRTHVDLESLGLAPWPDLGFLLVALTKLSSISPVTLEYLPIGAVLVLPFTYSLARRFIPSFYAALVASIVLVRIFSSDISSIWPHTFGYLLFFLFIYVFFELVKKRTIETLLALWIIFLGIHLYSYNAELFAISFLVYANVLMFARPKRYRLNTASLILACIITFFLFNYVVLSMWIPIARVYSTQLSTSFGYYTSIIARAPPPSAWLYIPPPSPPALIFLNSAWYALTFLPLVLVALYLIYITLRSRSISVLRVFASTTAIIFLSMFLVWPVDAITYSLIGAFSTAVTRYYFLICPIVVAVIVAYLLNKTPINGVRRRSPRIVGAYLGTLLIITALTLPLLASSGAIIISPERYTNVHPSALWFFNSTPNVDLIQSDQDTQGQYAIIGAKQGASFTGLNFYTNTSYGSLVDPGNTTGNGGSPSLLTDQYIVINLAVYTGRTTAGGNWDLEPLQPHMGAINSYSNLIRIYDDGNVLTLKGL